MTFNKELIEALESQVDIILKHVDENLEMMLKLNDSLNSFKRMNKSYLDQAKAIRKQINEMKAK